MRTELVCWVGPHTPHTPPPLARSSAALLNQVLQLTPEQINALPEDQRQQVIALLGIARQQQQQGGMVRARQLA